MSRQRRNPTFGENVRRLRDAEGITQEVLAKRLGVRQPDLSVWERGGVPSLEKLVHLARELNAPIDELVRGIDLDYDAGRSPARAALKRHAPPVDPIVADLHALPDAQQKHFRAIIADYAARGARRPRRQRSA